MPISLSNRYASFFLAGIALLASFASYAVEPPTEPILRFDLGEHTATIRRISTDDAGRYLVTGSDDKTARVWSLADGRLLSTLRLPIGNGYEGKLNAVALSPDGQTVALGGWTQFNNGSGSTASDGMNIFMFDRASGRLVRRITGLPNVINHLSFSPDGSALAATLGANNGLRIFSVEDGRLLAEDRDYASDSYSVQFSRNGKLITTSYDGYLRLYRFEYNQLSLLVKRAAPGGRQPLAARFSPDGNSIAVGFNDTAAVDVLSASDLTLDYALDTTGRSAVNSGLTGFCNIAWSQKGDFIFAGGYEQAIFNGHWQRYIRRWPAYANSTYKDLPVAGAGIMDMIALSEGRLVFSSQEPSWGIINAQGQRTLVHLPVGADFRDNQTNFALSADGTQVRFGYELYGNSPVVFDSQRRAFVDVQNLITPIFSGSGLNVTEWKNSYSPSLNGTQLKLHTNEMTFSLAVTPQRDGFVLGSNFYLRFFDREGTQRWQQPSPGAIWDANISQDGRWVVAAYSDGTIRWHRTTDGVEQLAFFPHSDKKRWVMWTPSGYYDASPGAEDLIGWHLNHGKDHSADFFPASRFHDRFYRPDVLAQVLNTQDEVEAVRLANQESGRRPTAIASITQVLPPVVELISPADLQTGETTLTLRYSTRTAEDAPVTAMRVRVNGQAVSGERALRPVRLQGEQSIDVAIPPHDSEIQLFAENRNGVSVPVLVRVKWAGKAESTASFNIKPKLYVLAIGVANYSSADVPKLGYSAKDAKDFAAAMKLQTQLYRDVEVKLLTDADATRDNIVDSLDWLQKQVTQHDVGMLFMAGHGVTDPTAGYYYLPVNADPDRLKRTGVSMADIRGTLASLTGKAIFFIDTCHAGNVLGAGRRGVNDMNGVINELSSAENGVVVFSSSTGKQYSLENDSWGNGAFTKAVIEGMKGGADYQKTGRITHKMLDLYVSERVKQLTNGQQSPVTQAPGGVPDFPVAAVR